MAMRTNDLISQERLINYCVPMRADCNAGEMLQAALGLTGEAGEVADLIKKSVFHNKPMDLVHLKKELGDVMWYVALMCHAYKFDLDEVMQLNIDKLKARYPEGFDTFKANHRKEGDV